MESDWSYLSIVLMSILVINGTFLQWETPTPS